LIIKSIFKYTFSYDNSYVSQSEIFTDYACSIIRISADMATKRAADIIKPSLTRL